MNLCPWDFPGRVLEWIPFPPPGVFLTQRLNSRLQRFLHLQMDPLPLSHQGSLRRSSKVITSKCMREMQREIKIGKSQAIMKQDDLLHLLKQVMCKLRMGGYAGEGWIKSSNSSE